MTKLNFRFIQLSDLHLLDNPEKLFFDKNPLKSLENIIQKINSLLPQADFLLLSGDMTHRGKEEAYKLLDEVLQNTDIPYYWLEGNHDDKNMMQKFEVVSTVNPARSFEHQGVYFILLDSVSDNKSHGEFSKKTLNFLSEQLEKSKSMPCVIAFHHHIIKTSCSWIDRSMVENSSDFFEITSQYSHIKMVLHGHIHNAVSQELNGLSIFSAPSTAFQFDLRQASFEKPAEVPAGFRIIDVDEAYNFTTKIERVLE